ncbi:MAG: DedA family protein [Acidimicrobiales bacterium]
MNIDGAANASGDPGAPPPDRSRPAPRSRRTLLLLIVPILVLVTLGTIGTIFTPALARRHPLVLLMLESRDRNLLAARHAALVPFVVIGVIRRVIADPFFFLLGRHYGDGAVRWLERHAGGPRVVRPLERAFRRAAYPMLVIFPGAIVCALAGEVGIPVGAFLVIVVVRTIAAVFVIRWLGNVFSGPIDAVLSFLDRNALVLTLILAVLTVGWLAWSRWHERHAGTGRPMSLSDLSSGPEPESPPAAPAGQPDEA